MSVTDTSSRLLTMLQSVKVMTEDKPTAPYLPLDDWWHLVRISVHSYGHRIPVLPVSAAIPRHESGMSAYTYWRTHLEEDICIEVGQRVIPDLDEYLTAPDYCKFHHEAVYVNGCPKYGCEYGF